jgi:hypothetical protein
MTERNPYSPYSYDTFDKVPPSRGGRLQQEETFKDRIMERMSNPVFAITALLITIAAFAGIIMISYPDGDEPADVPVVTADAGTFREEPTDRGGLEVAHQDSTVFNSIRSDNLQEEPPVEDLLAKEKPIDKLEAFAKEAESMFDAENSPPSEMADAKASVLAAADEETPPPSEITETEPAAGATKAAEKAAKEASNDSTAVKTVKIEQKVEKIPLAEAPVTAKAGTAPDTLAFVQSVLKEKDSKASGGEPTQAINTQAAPSDIEPAAGAATTTTKSPASGSYYVQLASVDAESKASVEWKNLQKKFTSLAGQQFRVQRADLAKGTFYRIQAGPMDKATATTVCNSIKAQKPGGCLITQ